MGSLLRLGLAAVAVLVVVNRGAVVETLDMVNGYGSKVACTLHFMQGRSLSSVMWQELSWPPIALFVRLTANETCVESKTWFAPFLPGRSACLHERGELGCALVGKGKTHKDYYQPGVLDGRNKHSAESPIDDFAKVALDEKLSHLKAVEDHFSNPFISSRALLVIDTSTYPARILVERYGEGYNRSTVQVGWSMTKSLIAMWAATLLYDNDRSVFPDGLSTKIHGDLTLEDLLRMQDTLDWDEVYGLGGHPPKMLFQYDEVSTPPAGYRSQSKCFQYSSKATNMISKYLKDRLKEKYHNHLFERLLRRINANSARVETDPSSVFVGSSFSVMTPTDWARFGVLVANKGVWPATGARLFSEEFIERARIPTKTARGVYGMHFWLGGNEKGEPDEATRKCDALFPTRLNPRDWFARLPKGTLVMTGFEGQLVIAHPETKLVVVRLGASREKAPLWPVFSPGDLFVPIFDELLRSSKK